MSRTTTRRVRTWIAAGALIAPAALIGAATSSFALVSPPAGCLPFPPGGATSFTCTYDFTGNPISFTVPTGVTSLDITMVGGAGGAGSNSTAAQPNAAGGQGASVHFTQAVTAGAVATINVGQKGADAVVAAAAGGGGPAVPNGGAGGTSTTAGNGQGGGGGGASAVSLDPDGAGPLVGNFVAVAGGGGGGGGGGTNLAGGAGGSAASPAAAGTAGSCVSGTGAGTSGSAGTAGAPGLAPTTGGAGGSGTDFAGGGGGGGAAPGGGGGLSGNNNCSGGGGGAGGSYAPAGATFTLGAPSSNGTVIVKYSTVSGVSALAACNDPSIATAAGYQLHYVTHHHRYVGGSGKEIIIGTDGNDTIYGGSNDDIICGMGGNDRIFGGSGSDQIDGGDGKDYIDGGSGHDTIVDTGNGPDTVDNSSGEDSVS